MRQYRVNVYDESSQLETVKSLLILFATNVMIERNLCEAKHVFRYLLTNTYIMEKYFCLCNFVAIVMLL